jgi:superfamily II DNA or RNA helicase
LTNNLKENFQKKKKMLTRQGFELDADDPRVKKAKTALCVAPVDHSGIGFPKKFNVWWNSQNKVVVPRFWALETFGACQQHFGMLRTISVEFCGSLRQDLDQLDATTAVMKSLVTTGGAVLSLGTGQGKTTCACWVIAQLRVKTVVLVHKDVLKLQWAERIAQFLPAARVSYIQGTTCDTSGDIVIAMLQTLVSPGRTFDFSGVGCVVVDECFPYDQLISTEDGPMCIGDVYTLWQRGEAINVWSYDETSKTFRCSKVTHAWEKRSTQVSQITFRNELGITSTYRATPNHPVLTTTRGWKDTGDVLPGDVLTSMLGPLIVESVDVITLEDTRVYDLEVQETHTFLCHGGPVVHNCHHISAETFSTAMHGLCCPYSLGLSATPTRKDGLTRVMHWFLGPQAYQTQRRHMNQVVVDFLRYTCPRYKLPPPTTRFGTVNFAAVLTDIADDTQRTDMIVARILEIRQQDPERIVLVLSHRRDHCLEFAKKIPGAVAFLGGARKKTTVDHQTAPVVCATYALASEGYDDPRLNTLVLATPCSDVTQAAGRILRGTSVKNPLIVDVQDDFSVAYAQSAKRKNYYRIAGFTYATQIQKEYPKCIIID